MIESFNISGKESFLELSSYLIGGIIGLAGIVAAVLLFLVERKISQSTIILDNLILRHMECDLDYKKVKFGMAIYARKWNEGIQDTWMKFSLCTFFISAFFLVSAYLYLLCFLTFSSSANLVFIIFNAPLIIFMFIIYELIFAPDTIIFNKWRPNIIIRSHYPYNEIAENYLGYLDLEDIKELEYDKYRKVILAVIRNIDRIKLRVSNVQDIWRNI